MIYQPTCTLRYLICFFRPYRESVAAAQCGTVQQLGRFTRSRYIYTSGVVHSFIYLPRPRISESSLPCLLTGHG